MFRRRPKPDATGEPSDVEPTDAATDDEPEAEPQQSPPPVAGKPVRANGPWDVDELDGSHPSHGRDRIDLGGLRIRPLPGMQVQMQVDNATGRSTSVLMVSEQAAVQLMVIAAAKSTPLWPSTIGAVSVDARRRGGTAEKASGPWGDVLRISLPVTTPDGASGVQPSIVIGVDGPRWMLRATLIGAAAVDQQVHNRMLAVVQDTVVVRGEQPMPPGELIELKPPARADAALAGDDEGLAEAEPEMDGQDDADPA